MLTFVFLHAGAAVDNGFYFMQMSPLTRMYRYSVILNAEFKTYLMRVSGQLEKYAYIWSL